MPKKVATLKTFWTLFPLSNPALKTELTGRELQTFATSPLRPSHLVIHGLEIVESDRGTRFYLNKKPLESDKTYSVVVCIQGNREIENLSQAFPKKKFKVVKNDVFESFIFRLETTEIPNELKKRKKNSP